MSVQCLCRVYIINSSFLKAVNCSIIQNIFHRTVFKNPLKATMMRYKKTTIKKIQKILNSKYEFVSRLSVDMRWFEEKLEIVNPIEDNKR